MINYFGEQLDLNYHANELDFLKKQLESGYDVLSFPEKKLFNIYGLQGSCTFYSSETLEDDWHEDSLYVAVEVVISIEDPLTRVRVRRSQPIKRS